MSSPIPLLLFGKIPTHIKATKDVVKPEFEVVEHAPTVEDGKRVIPELFGDTPKVSAVIMGGGFSKDDAAELISMTSVPWFRPEQMDPNYTGAMPTSPPSAEEIADRLKKALLQHMDEVKEGKLGNKILYF